MGEYLVIVKAVVAGILIFSALWFYRKHVIAARAKAIKDFCNQLRLKRVDSGNDRTPTFAGKIDGNSFLIGQVEVGSKYRHIQSTLSTDFKFSREVKESLGITKIPDMVMFLRYEGADAFSDKGTNSFFDGIRNTLRSAVGIQDIEIGDEYLDRVFLIKGISTEFVQNFFTDSIKEKMKALFEAKPYSIVITGRNISFECIDGILDSSYYKDAIDLAMEFKKALESSIL